MRKSFGPYCGSTTGSVRGATRDFGHDTVGIQRSSVDPWSTGTGTQSFGCCHQTFRFTGAGEPLDLKKAYPNSSRNAFYTVMRHFGASEGILRVIEGLIQLTQYRCRAGKILSEPFTMQRGFKEGCPASPVEFNFLQEGILRTWRQKMAEHGPPSKLTITCGILQDTDHATTRSLDPRWLAQHADEISVWQEHDAEHP